MRPEIIPPEVAKARRVTIEASAYHEAGHAVVAWRHNNIIREHGISIDGQGLGQCHVRPQVFSGEGQMMKTITDGGRAWRHFLYRVEAKVECDQAGMLVEIQHHQLIRPDGVDVISYELEDMRWLDTEGHLEAIEGWSDINFALWTLADARRAEAGHTELTSEDFDYIVRWYLRLQTKVARYIKRPRTWGAITALAEALIEHRKVDADRAEAILAEARAPTLAFR